MRNSGTEPSSVTLSQECICKTLTWVKTIRLKLLFLKRQFFLTFKMSGFEYHNLSILSNIFKRSTCNMKSVSLILYRLKYYQNFISEIIILKRIMLLS